MTWQEWYQEIYLTSDHWFAFRAYILRVRPRCEICHVSYGLQVHHRNYKHLWHEGSNDVCVLCERCHKMISGEGPWMWRMGKKLVKWLTT